MLAYDFQRLFTDYGRQGQAGLAVIERDMSQPDAYGAHGRADWQTLRTVQCVLYWAKSNAGGRGANREHVSPARRVPIEQGEMIVPAGVDVTEQDRIAQMLDREGAVIEDGVFEITGVLNEGTHMELMVTRPHLGG